MSFDMLNSYGVPMPPHMQTGMVQPQPNVTNMQPIQQPQINPVNLETPKITTQSNDGFKMKFTITDDSGVGNIPVDRDVPDVEEKRPRTRRKKDPNETSSGIIRAKAGEIEVVEDTPTMYTYMETTNMLHDTLGQIDALNSELMQEFESVRCSRTMKNKYNTLVGLSQNVGSLINNRIQVIKEINAAITKANDLDYKKEKDRKSAMANVDDDKYIADLYKSFMQNPSNLAPSPQLPQVDPSLFGSGIVRADLGGSSPTASTQIDASYLSYLSNLSPEQNLMRYENNPNVKQVVVFDAATGNRFFQMMDVSTGTVIPNVPVYDAMFLEDTTLDIKNKIAKNINLNETFPIVVINEGVTEQY